MYITSGIRPDISYSVNYLSRFQDSYSEEHFKHGIRVLKYLNSSKNLAFSFNKSGNVDLNVFVDAHWASIFIYKIN